MKIIKTAGLILTFCILFSGVFAQMTKTELIVQTGHSLPVDVVAFSPDGSVLASGSNDKTVKLWNVESGVELRTLSGHPEEIRALAFNTNGQKLVSASEKSVIVWDIAAGKKDIKIDDLFVSLKAVVYDQKQEIIAVDDTTDAIKIWNITEGKNIFTIPENTAKASDFIKADFSRDGSLLVYFIDNQVTVWSIETQKKLLELKGHQGNVNSAAFSFDNKSLITTGDDHTVKIWNLKTGKEIKNLTGSKNQFGQAEIFNSASFNLDGSKIIAGGDQTDKVWETTSGKLLRTIPLSDNIYVRSVAFSPNGTFIAEGNSSSRLRLLNADSGETLFNLPKEIRFKKKGNLAFSRDGKLLATRTISSLYNGSAINFWNLRSGEPQAFAKTEFGNYLEFSPNSAVLADAQIDGIKLLDRYTGKEIYNLKITAPQEPVFSPDGNYIAAVGELREINDYQDHRCGIRLWNITTGKEIYTTETFCNTHLTSNSFSPDGKTMAISISTGRPNIKILSVDSGKEIYSMQGSKFPVGVVGYSPDGKMLVSGDYNGKIKLWNTSNWTINSTIDALKSSVNLIAFNHDGNLIAAAGENDGEVKILNLNTQTELFTFQADSAEVKNIAFNSDGKILATLGSDTQIKLWSAETGKQLAALIEFSNNDWLVMTPEGLFDGTPKAWKQLFWRFNNNTFDYSTVETYFNDFFYPNLLQDILAGKSPQPKAGSELEKIDRRQPKVEIAAVNGQTKSQLTANSVTDKLTTIVSIEVADNTEKKKQPDHQETGGAKDLRLFRNDSLVKVWHDDVFETKQSGCEKIETKPNEPRRVRCRAEIQIIAGENNLTAYAFNSANVKSNDDTVSIKGEFPKKDGTLYVLAVGVNKYANSAYDLRFAVPDVLDIETALKEQQDKLSIDTKLKQYARTEVITLKDETATKDNILLALSRFSKDAANKLLPENLCANLASDVCTELKTELAKIKPTMPEDALIIYYAGHGTSKEQRFYLLPHNFTGANGEKSLDEQGVSDIELNETLEKVDAGRLLMVIDACQSGQALGGEKEGRGPMNSKGLAQLAYDKGMLILTAAQSQQAALEAVNIGGREIKHGLLTYALLQGLSDNRADKDGNKQIWEREWLDYAVEQVPQLQLEAMRQRSAEIQQTGRGSQLVYMVGDNANAAPNDRRVQTPRVFYKRETETNPMIVAQP